MRILITGASRGIGRATAIALAQRGHRVVLAARDEQELRRVAEQIGPRAEVVRIDVTNEESVARGVARVFEDGAVDVLVNNAGSCDQAGFLAQSERTRRAEMELNYWGAQRMTCALLPSMIERRSGAIVNVSSLLGFVASPTTANYSATKAALNAWSNALRGEVAHHGLRVVVFVAPHTQTDCGRGAKFDGVVSLPVEYTAQELVRAIERAPRQYAASPVYRMLLRLARWFPAFMEARVAASARRYLPA
jgi:short-subunit dehydrogenase